MTVVEIELELGVSDVFGWRYCSMGVCSVGQKEKNDFATEHIGSRCGQSSGTLYLVGRHSRMGSDS